MVRFDENSLSLHPDWKFQSHIVSLGPYQVTAIAWSQNAQRLAVVGVDKIVQLYDEHGEKQDRSPMRLVRIVSIKSNRNSGNLGFLST